MTASVPPQALPYRRITYARSVHGQDEIDAVVGVLTNGHQGLRIGTNVDELERRIAELSGKRRGLMCNSGSSALYLAIELLDLPAGSEVITSPLTFSTDVAPIVRAGLVPVFVDVEPDTFNVDVAGIEALITDRTRALLIPNLAGNAPDWDEIRRIADRHGLAVIEDNCDALGATLRGTPTGGRADLSVTSFAMTHIITCAGNGGMVLTDDDALRSDLQESIESAGIDTRTVWSGNVTGHPMMDGVTYRVPGGGLPRADAVLARGMSLGMSHGMDDDEVAHVVAAIHAFSGIAG